MSTTLSAIVGDIGDLVVGSTNWISSAVGAVVGSPLLLFFILISFCSIGFGLFRRFFA